MNEKEVRERLNRFKTIKVLYGNTFAIHLEQLEQLQNDIETVLNLLEKKDRTIQQLKDENRTLNRQAQQYFEQGIKKDKIIDLLIKKLYTKAHISTRCYLQTSTGECMKHKNCYECLKKYFEKKEKGKNNEYKLFEIYKRNRI